MTALVIDVGCLECNGPTTIFGPLWPTVEDAKASVPDHHEWDDPRVGLGSVWGGQAMYAIIDLNLHPPEIVAAARWRYNLNREQG